MLPDQLRTLAAQLHEEARDDDHQAATDFGRRLADLFELAANIAADGFARADREELLAATRLLAQATEALYEPEDVQAAGGGWPRAAR